MTVSFLADENFNGDLVRAMRRRLPSLDVVTVHLMGLAGIDDTEILEWAARAGRVVLTHDLATMPMYAYERVRRGERLAGLVAIPGSLPLGVALDDLLLVLECGVTEDFEGQVWRLPLRTR